MENTQASQISRADIWRMPLILTGSLIVLLLLIYYPTTASIIHIWNTSETFTHGYLILPISIWLIWHNRHHFHYVQPSVNYFSVPLLLLVSFAWLVAYFVDVNVVQQLALVAMIPLIVFGVMGWQVTKAAAFPLFFLIFAVPMGEALVPSLIEFTADFTVAMVQMTGIPIYREGTFFQLPTGNWSVVEACSGVRYLIASVTLGFLYAYLTYQSPYRRAAFILASIIVPIIANGFRAFLIVMIGHFSGMKLAVGVDHLIYGWVFFGIVIAIMFYVGSFWREEEAEVPQARKTTMEDVKPTQNQREKQFLLASLVLLAIVSLLPVKAYTDKVEIPADTIVINAPKSGTWKLTDNMVSSWQPRYKNMDALLNQNYQKESASINLFIGYYQVQRENAQLVTSTNVLVEEKDDWQNIGNTVIEAQLSTGAIKLPVAHLKLGSKEILVAYFYYLGGERVTNDYVAKLIEAKARLLGGDRSSAIIAISSELDGNRDQVISDIQSFIKDMDGEIGTVIDSAGHSK